MQTMVRGVCRTHLNGATVLALAADGCEVTLKDLDMESSLEQGNCEHQPADTSTGDEHARQIVCWLICARLLDWGLLKYLPLNFGDRLYAARLPV